MVVRKLTMIEEPVPTAVVDEVLPLAAFCGEHVEVSVIDVTACATFKVDDLGS